MPPLPRGLFDASATLAELGGTTRDLHLGVIPVNSVNEELAQLCGVTRRLGGAWRPWGQGAVEREHQEEARQLGIFLGEVFRCSPGDWAGFLPPA